MRPSTTGSRTCRLRHSPTARFSTPGPPPAWSSTATVRELPGAQQCRDAIRPARGAQPDLEGLLRPAFTLLADRPDPRPASTREVRDTFLVDGPVLRGCPQRRTAGLLVHRAEIIGHAHNDMHPAFSMLTPGLNWDPPSSLIAGEDLLARVYNAIRSSASQTGSNCFNTLFMVVFDEHGGTYDHVPPPAATPPDPAGPPGQMGFTFNRLGIRVPAIAISPWIPEKTVVTDTYRNTSVIRTLRERWNLGLPFTARDADAPDLSRVFTLDVPREPENWPDVVARPVPVFDQPVVPLDAPLSPLAQAMTMGFLELVKQLGQTVPEIEDPAKLKGGEAIELVHEAIGHLFPGLQRSSRDSRHAA